MRPSIAAAVLGTLTCLAVLPSSAAGAAARYRRCAATEGVEFVMVARASCRAAETLAAVIGATAPDASATALVAQGWTPVRARQVPGREPLLHDLVAMRGRAAVRIRRRGLAPDLDGWSAGRELIFSRHTIVGGRPVPRDSAFCTSAFLVLLPGGRAGGLSAAHCAGLRANGTSDLRNAAMRRPPAPGIVLGRVRRNLARTVPLDALVLPVPRGDDRPRSAIVDRGVSRPPWAVRGTARLLAGRRICFTGHRSGIDRCGRLSGRGEVETYLALRTGVIVRCTDIAAREGDSGGPVYTAPRADGTVRALGIVTLIVGLERAMCFTPLAPVLQRLDARLVTVP
jgi:hypothetical protein